ncbi:zinc ribbon domain-containing protein [bacterium]|nr:zinc ribbon domain-containing protein [bacterium]
MTWRKCPNCGAPASRGATRCLYCGSEWWGPIEGDGDEPEFSGDRERAPTGGAAPAIVPMGANATRAGFFRTFLFVVLVPCCPPVALLWLWLAMPWRRGRKALFTGIILALIAWAAYEIDDATVRVDGPKFSTSAPDLAGRAHETIGVDDVFRLMRDEALPRETRKERFLAQYAGRWVRWSGTVDEVSTYTTMASEVRVDPFGVPPPAPKRLVRAFMDPAANAMINDLTEGAPVTVSGRLFGYDFFLHRVEIADAIPVNGAPASGEPLPGFDLPDNGPNDDAVSPDLAQTADAEPSPKTGDNPPAASK